MSGPLDGLRVVELGVWIAGPATGGILADWGADVIKIEPLGGDPARLFQQMLGGDMPNNPVFELDNRSKRSIALDLTTEGGLAIANDLVAEADVFVTNVRLAGLKRLRLDQATLTTRHPRLVYAAITGYGTEGPEADRAAYDIAAFWARSGIAHMLTAPGSAPPFQRGGMGDHGAALSAAGMICAALYSREQTGEGQFVTTSLFRQGVYTIGFDLSVALGWGLTLQLADRDNMPNPAINNYMAGDDRRFWICGLEGDRHWPPLARIVGHPEWLDDQRFATVTDRATNARDLISELDAIFATKSLDEWAGIFATEPEFFWAPIQTPDDLLADPQFHAAGCLIEVPDGPTTTPMIATPADFHGTPCQPRSMAPGIGEHTAEILESIGRGDQIEILRAGGAISASRAQ